MEWLFVIISTYALMLIWSRVTRLLPGLAYISTVDLLGLSPAEAQRPNFAMAT